LASFDDELRQEEAEMSKDQDKITLRVDGTRKQLDTSRGRMARRILRAGWRVAWRGGSARSRTPLDPDAVLELELANGTRILVAAADAESYLGTRRRARRG
jgi:hypothetical protein